MAFVRFKNVGKVKKFIGFQVEEEKEFIFDIMIQSIVHFPIPESYITIVIKPFM